MKIGADGWISDPQGVVYAKVPTRRTCKLTTGTPLGTVSHWSADPVDERGHADALYLARSIAELPPAGTKGASWHVLLDRDGALVQSAPFTVGTWHVGRPGVVEGRKLANVNDGTIGVEFENAGILLPIAGEYYGWPFWNHSPKDAARTPDPKLGPCPKYLIPKERVVVLPETAAAGLTFPAGAYEVYTEAQEATFQRLVEALMVAYKLPPSAFLYGHAHFVPMTFKQDPGPLWLGQVVPRMLRAIARTQP